MIAAAHPGGLPSGPLAIFLSREGRCGLDLDAEGKADGGKSATRLARANP
jgi:hypothetical protein